MRKLVLIVALVVLSLGSAACGFGDGLPVDGTFVVERVFMHQVGDFSVLMRGPNKTLIPKELPCYRSDTGCTLVKDVSAGDSMYVEYKGRSVGGNGDEYNSIIIHLRAAEDVGGAGYRYGKSGIAQTKPIESGEPVEK